MIANIRQAQKLIKRAKILEDSIWTKPKHIESLAILLNSEPTTYNIEQLSNLVDKVLKYNKGI